jgi:hypothetical protein
MDLSGGLVLGLLVLLLSPVVVLAIHAALNLVNVTVWTTLAAGVVVVEYLYLGFRQSPSRPPLPVAVRERLFLAAVSLTCVGAAWLFAASAALGAIVTGRPAHWHFVGLAGFLIAVIVAAAPTYLRAAIGRSYQAPAEGDPAYAELRSRIGRWSNQLHLAAAPELVVSRVRDELPHVVGVAGRCRLAVPANYLEIERATRERWPTLADGLLDFTVAHQLTHVANGDWKGIGWFRALLGLLARWLVPGVLATGLVGSLWLGAGGVGHTLLVLVVVAWTTALMLLGVFTQLLVVMRDREALAAAGAFALVGQDGVAALREPPAPEGEPALDAYLGLFGLCQGPLLGERVPFGERAAAPGRHATVSGRLGAALARAIDRLAGTQAGCPDRLRALGLAGDPEPLVQAREHGLMSGLTLAALQAVVVIDGALLGFHNLLRLEWIWAWVCTGVLIFVNLQPVRCMEIRARSAEPVASAVARSHTWSVLVALAGVLLFAVPAMAVYAELWGVALAILLFLLAAHAAAAYLGTVYISSACP